jgi:hypothetical protein
MHQGVFVFDAEFEVQRGEFREPFAVFANFHAAASRNAARPSQAIAGLGQ